MTPEIVSTADRPEFVPVVARWLWCAFARGHGRTLEYMIDAVGKSVTASRMPRTFVLLADGSPRGTASLVVRDLEERPDLTPWLAGVYVDPAARRLGHATRLISAVERQAVATGVPTLWLYTNTAERLYARAGWRTVETIQHNGAPHALMRRDFVTISE